MLCKVSRTAKGQSLVEFALILPVLLLIILGVVEFGRIFFLYTEASNAAREAARYGVAAGESPNGLPRYLDCGEIRQAALDTTILSNFAPVTDTIEIAYDYPVENSTQILGNCEAGFEDDDIQQGYRIVVTVTADFKPILPIIPIPDLTFTPSSRRTILKDIIIQNEPELPPAPPGCRLLQYTSNPSAGGTVTASPDPNCGGTWYLVGTDVTLTAVPNNGYNFSFWGISPDAPGSGSTNPVVTIRMDNNFTAVANFSAIICHEIEEVTNPIEGGIVQVLTPENCPNNTGWIEGTGVQLKATANIGWQFVNWTDSKGTYTGSTLNPLIIGNGELTSDRTLTANFTQPVPDCYDIALQIGPADVGTVTITPPRGAGCPNGWIAQDVVLSPEPNDPNAYEFDSWGADAAAACPSNNAPCTMTVNSNKTVVANFTQVAEVADLFIQKSDSVDPATVGQQYYYTLVVGNLGPDGANDVRIMDTLPPTVSPISAVSSQGSCTISGIVVECTIGNLPANTSQTVNITVLPNSVGTIHNVAFVFNNDPNEIDTNQSNNSDSETTKILPSADLVVTKSGPATAHVGDTLTYNISVSNNGPSAAALVKLVDALPLTVNYLNHTISNGACTHAGTQLTCNLGNMPADGQPVNITVQGIATAQSVAINQATVSSDTGDPSTVNNTATASTTIGSGQSPFITLSPTCGSAGEGFTVKGYNWPTSGNVDTTIHWDSTANAPIASVPDSVVELGNGIWIKAVTIPTNATTGLHTVFARHPQGQGTTKSATITVPCPAPDLVISSKVRLVSPTPVNQGDPVSFQVTITNTGVTQAVSQFPVSLYFNPDPAPTTGSTHIDTTFKVASFAVNGISVGSSKVITLTAQSGFPISGTNTVYAVVDSDPSPEGQIDETIETNNISSVFSIDVQPCVNNCGGGNQTGNGILAGQAFVPSVSGELLPQPNVYVLLVGPTITQTQFTFTNNNGTYVFSDLPTGSYTVSGCINIESTSYFFSIAVNIVSGLQHFQDMLLTEGVCV